MDDFEIVLKNEFLEEAAQSLSDTEQCFLLLESEPGNIENLNKIFRLAHNLKGSSKAVGFMSMSTFTHHFETFILKVKNGKVAPSQLVTSLMFEANDFLVNMVEGLRKDHNSILNDDELISRFNSIESLIADQSNSGGEDKKLVDTEQVSSPESEEHSDNLSETDCGEEACQISSQHEVSQNSEQVVEIEPNLDLLQELLGQFQNLNDKKSLPQDMPKVGLEEDPLKLRSEEELIVANKNESSKSKDAILDQQELLKTSSTGKANSGAEEMIRVSVSKLESLINYVGEMAILQSVLKVQSERQNWQEIKKSVTQISKVGKEIQDISMSLRMVPVKPVFQKMQRIVRDTALAVNKDVELVLIGENTELDKTVLEKLNDPLVHLIRNSVDHGIESPSDRESKGKSKKGKVTLSAQQMAGKLVIEIKDDGAGLNSEKLKRKAIEKGIVNPNAQLSEKDCYDLIFAPGFSTKEQVTEVSGRGVGMDVVKTNIAELSGDVAIISKLGSGTTFRITLPLTLAIIDGLIVTHLEDRFIIPLGQVHETMCPKKDQLQYNQGLGSTLMLRGENIPAFKLGEFFGKENKKDFSEMIALIIRTSSQPYALFVDDIIGQDQVVIKKLSKEFQQMKGLSGSTILGDGRPALILEPNEIVKRVRTSFPSSAQEKKMTNLSGGKAA